MSEPEPHLCSAHGLTKGEHDVSPLHANDCTAPSPLGSDDCPDCQTYAITGMHWDTCQYRGRNSRPAPEDPGPHVGEPVSEIHVELQRLDAFVRACQAMATDPERRRALNYLRDRFPGPHQMRG
jgi:hypothetical protein